MCGIVCIASENDIVGSLLLGLKRLAYRGYDSAGIATVNGEVIIRSRAEGKIINLENRLKNHPVSGSIGIGHTRWATHGGPSELNAHPHATDKVAIVHNGIIENYKDLAKELFEKGYKFTSETDSEVIVHLLTEYLNQGLSENEAVMKLTKNLKGAYALGILFSNSKKIIGVKRGSPLAIGYGNDEMFIGSDAICLAPLTNKISYLEDGDWVVMDKSRFSIYDLDGNSVIRPVKKTSLSGQSIEKGGYKHFMHKEIHEQPTVVGETLKNFIDLKTGKINLDIQPIDCNSIDRITMVACGTSSYACRIAREWFENYANIPVTVDIASEYRYRKLIPQGNELAIFISQSGETKDTISCIEHAKKSFIQTMSIVNVIDSSISRISDKTLLTLAGPEIGVASTKAFTTQLVTLASLALKMASSKGLLESKAEVKLSKSLLEIPSQMSLILEKENIIRRIASEIYDYKDILYIGRGSSHGVALEGALKLKEISYIHAEGYAAGELKHGPIALVDENMPIIGIIPSNNLFDKTASNLAEAYARGGNIIAITDEEGANKISDIAKKIIICPGTINICQPALYTLPVQLLAYHVADFKGTDIDQPRNLAKSVTVE